MKKQPTIKTEHLILRPYSLNDTPELQRLIGDRDIASTTANIPHPYEDGMAEEWIGKRQESFNKGETVDFAITHRQDGFFMGGISLGSIDKYSELAEIGYWIGKPYWGHGYVTEAARAVLKYGFEVMELNRIHSRHFSRNPASGRVMQKIGMIREGYRRQHFKKWGKFEDIELYGILRSEYLALDV
jgi:ribosomal-protein-alanine N-acetyltransferase